MNEINLEQARFNMIEQQIRPWEVLDQRILQILTETPREHFVPARYRNLAFADVAIPLGHDQVMMKPNVEGRLLQALTIKPFDTILEVGTGSGFLTACLAQLGASVVSVDYFADFTESARQKLDQLGIHNIRLQTGDAATMDWGHDHFDVIAFTGSLTTLPNIWRERLARGGRLFSTMGDTPIMEALLVTRTGDQQWSEESLFDTEIPPLLNFTNPVSFQF